MLVCSPRSGRAFSGNGMRVTQRPAAGSSSVSGRPRGSWSVIVPGTAPFGVGGEEGVHPARAEDVAALDAEGVPQLLEDAEAHVEGDAAVRGAVGEELVHVLRRVRAPVGEDLLQQAAAEGGGVLQAELLRSRAPAGGGRVMETVDPNAVRGDFRVRVQIRFLAVFDEDVVALVEVEAEPRALELMEGRFLSGAHPHMRGSLVEAVAGSVTG